MHVSWQKTDTWDVAECNVLLSYHSCYLHTHGQLFSFSLCVITGKDHFTLFQKHICTLPNSFALVPYVSIVRSQTNQFLSFQTQSARLDYHFTSASTHSLCLSHSSFILLSNITRNINPSHVSITAYHRFCIYMNQCVSFCF